MRAISCAIVFLACVLAAWGITYEEIHTGKDLHWASVTFGIIAVGAGVRWWQEVRRNDP